MASYPSSVKSWSARTDTSDDVMADDVNTLYDEVTALETEIGTDPAGTVTDVKTRLARSLDGAGNLDYATATTLTIASGVITPTQNFHKVDTESAAASDDLATIAVTNVTEGFRLTLRSVDDNRDVVVKHGTGNIYNPQGVDITLGTNQNVIELIYDDVLDFWLVMSSPIAARPNSANTFTAANKFNAALDISYLGISGTTTLDATHCVVNADATGGAITVNLPTAVGIAGRIYYVRKKDVSANAVTLDGNGAETINGTTTHALSSQYQTATIVSDGAGWIIV